MFLTFIFALAPRAKEEFDETYLVSALYLNSYQRVIWAAAHTHVIALLYHYVPGLVTTLFVVEVRANVTMIFECVCGK
jgi:hypothetical protein